MFNHNKLDAYKAMLELTESDSLTFNKNSVIFEIGEKYTLIFGKYTKMIQTADRKYFKKKVAKEILPEN